MTLTFTRFFQLIAFVLQVLTAINLTSLPVKWQAVIAMALAALQAAQGIAAHYFTPTGEIIPPRDKL